MIEADAEWYLRRCAEDELLARSDESRLPERARALVAAGVLPRDVARGILRLYGRAASLRGRDQFPDDTGRSTVDPTPPRVSRCGRTFEQKWGAITVHYVLTAPNRCRIAISSTGTPPASARGHGHFMPPGVPPPMKVMDDRGKRHTGEFCGSGSDQQQHGYYDLEPPWPFGTTWISIFGQRIDLVHSPSDVSVVVEELDAELPVADRAARHLTHCLEADGNRRGESDRLVTAIETFVSCGILTEQSEAVQQSLAVRKLLLPRRKKAISGIPERWRSVITRRGGTGGAVGTRVVGATTPVFDGTRVTVLQMRADGSRFEVDFVTAGEVGRMGHASVDEGLITITGADDVGNHYLAGLTSYGWNDEGGEGTARFSAPLDPAATSFDLCFSSDNARAILRIPLHWDAAQ